MSYTDLFSNVPMRASTPYRLILLQISVISYSFQSDVDPHWPNVDPDPDPQNLIKGRIQVNKTYFSKHLLIFRSEKKT